MAPEASELVGYGLGGSGLLALGTWVVRKFMLSWSADRNVMAIDEVNTKTVERLQGEIARLETLVSKMGDKIESLDSRLNRIKQFLIEIQGEMVNIEVELSQCSCSTMPSLRVRLAELRKKMIEADI